MSEADLPNIRFTAQQAAEKAEAAHDLAKAVSGHLATISQGFEGMRAENTTQHRENAQLVQSGFEKVHERISSVKMTLDHNLQAVAERFNILDKTVVKTTAEFMTEIHAAKAQAKEGDSLLETRVQSRAFSITWKLVLLLLAIIAGLIGFITRGQLVFGS